MRLPAPALAALLLLAIAVLIGLGVWQLQRNEWRNDLVAERNARHDAGTMDVAVLAELEPEAIDFHRARAEGAWDHDRTMVLANRVRFGTKGEEIATPLLLSPEGPALLVNRGWYPEGEREAVLAALVGASTAVVEGLARYDGRLSARETPEGTWTGLAPASMGEVLPYDVLPWFVIEGDMLEPGAPSPPDLPVQGYLPYTSPVPHMEYALTWFGIAAALAAVAVIRFVVVPRRERARSATAHNSNATDDGAAASVEREPSP